MTTQQLLAILSSQKEELEANDIASFVSRYEEPLINLDSKMAQVVIGVRRSGKSTICEKVLREKIGEFAYINFDGNERMHILFSGDFSIDRIVEGLSLEAIPGALFLLILT